MGATSYWASAIAGSLQHLASTRPYTSLLLAVVALYASLFTLSILLFHNPKVPFLEVRSDKRGSIFNRVRSLDWFLNGPKLIHEAYEKHRDVIFQVPSQDRTSIVLPPKFLDEIRYLPQSIASNSRATRDFFFGAWTTLDMDVFLHSNIDAIKTQYIAKIGQQVSPAYDEAAYAFSKEFENYDDWTPIAIQPKLLHVVAQTVARTIVGPEICRHPKWVSSSIGYAENVFLAAISLKMVPAMMRPLIAAFTPFLYRIHANRRTIRSIIGPVIEQRLAWKRYDPKSWKAHLKTEQTTSVDWVVDRAEPENANPKTLTQCLIGTSFGSSHTTSNHLGNCILELAADFDNLAPALRAEMDSVLGHDHSALNNADLSKMWKLDSFMKECQRFHPPSKLSVNRTFVQDYTLSTGDVIPAGVHVSFAGVPMGQTEEFFENAKDFDAFRFERLRLASGDNQTGLQFANSFPGALHFGYGKQMCPGRFMGGLISKIVLIRILDRYDLKLREGEKRPANMTFMEMDAPDPTYQILIRDRKRSSIDG